MIENRYPLKNSLKTLRLNHSWTQLQVAQKIGVSRKTICSIEKGKIIPSILIALRLAELFQTRVENLFRLSEQLSASVRIKQNSV